MIYSNVFDVVLDDVFLQLPGFVPHAHTFLKLEGLNPAGSIKLKTALSLVQSAERSGRITPETHLIESSSGNLGIALAAVCAAKRYRLTVVTDPNTNRHATDQMKALAAEVVEVGTRDSNGGFLASRINYILDRLALEPELVWLNQYANRANSDVHRDRTATAIHQELGAVDHLYVGVGTSGTAMGCVQYFSVHSPETEICLVDSVGSVTFGTPAGPRWIPGMGTSRRPELFRDFGHFRKLHIAEKDAVSMCRKIVGRYGVLVGGSTGSVLSAVERDRCRFGKGSRIAVISPDFGERYLDTIYCDQWVQGHFPTLLCETGSS